MKIFFGVVLLYLMPMFSLLMISIEVDKLKEIYSNDKLLIDVLYYGFILISSSLLTIVMILVLLLGRKKIE